MASVELYAYATRIVRVFPGHAESAIWFPDPVSYEESQLSADLVDRLIAWEAFFYTDDTAEHPSQSLERLHRFSNEGLELARAVAAEIGPEFEVAYQSFEDRGAVAQLRSEEPATNSAARAAFVARAQRAR